MSRHFYNDIKVRISTLEINVVFDVGANIGQTAKAVSSAFPAALVYSFEPVSDTFRELEKSTASLPNVKCFNIALSAREGTAKMTAKPLSTSNAIQVAESSDGTAGETVPMTMGQTFCKANRIKSISILKVDTEGHDLDVILGFSSMIQQHRIDFIQVECSMNPHNRKHVAFRDFCGFLEPQGYVLFGIYDQVAEFKKYPYLRRANPVFVSERLRRASPKAD